jgi:hypothetical protein
MTKEQQEIVDLLKARSFGRGDGNLDSRAAALIESLAKENQELEQRVYFFTMRSNSDSASQP